MTKSSVKLPLCVVKESVLVVKIGWLLSQETFHVGLGQLTLGIHVAYCSGGALVGGTISSPSGV